MVTLKNTVTIGDGIKVVKVAHGLMLMTWKPTPVPDEDAFAAIKAGIDALPPDTKIILNSGEFYGTNPPTANLELVARFFEKYPSYKDKAFLSVKGGVNLEKLYPDSSDENLHRSITNILASLRGTKSLDLFECARVDKSRPIEEVMRTLKGFVDEGKIGYVGMSECGAETLRRAHEVCKVAVVEIEISPWSYEEETRKVIATAKELGIAVCGYSPLGRGFLTGSIKSPADLEDGDFRKGLSRFTEESFKHNMAIVDALKGIADKKGVSPAQLCIAWVGALGEHVIPLPGSSNQKRTLENLAGGDVELSKEELEEIEEVLKKNPVMGHRYFGDDAGAALWG